jgi:hypothetical protein
MIEFKVDGDFKNIEAFLKRMSKLDIQAIMNKSGNTGVIALARATPVETGLAASSWKYEVSSSGGKHTISWLNGDVENGFHVVIALQYGYGTGTGGYIQGRDFINPAIRPIFDKIADDVWKAVTSA